MKLTASPSTAHRPSGKDTVTTEPCKRNDAYAYFEKLKAGAGRDGGYRMTSDEVLAEMRDRDRGCLSHR